MFFKKANETKYENSNDLTNIKLFNNAFDAVIWLVLLFYIINI